MSRKSYDTYELQPDGTVGRPRRSRRGRLFSILLAMFGFSLALIVAPAAEAETISIGEVAPAGINGGCFSCISFQLQNAPGTTSYSVPPGQWTLESWSGQGGLKEGTVRLEIFRPAAEPGQYELAAQSPFETVPAATLSTFPVSIPVQGGDVIGIMTGVGSYYPPSALSPDLNDIDLGVSGYPLVGDSVGPGTAHATSTFGARRVNVAATLSRPDLTPPPTSSPGPSPSLVQTLSVFPEGNGTIASTGGQLHCPDACAAAVPVGTGMTIVATPGPRAEFVGWTGACAGIGPTCTVTVDKELRANAKFLPSHAFTLGKVKRRKAGTVQTATVENSGSVSIAGKGVVAGKVAAKKAGKVKLPLVARGATLRKLETDGVAKTLVRVTYRPDGGTPKIVTETVTIHG
ncbi:MAG: hypothetical protein JST59_24820 [Actinobacteria bacterium]|nr:hypothetical protein [Actinomycetota bacterium]